MKLVMVTCYDATFAKLCAESEVIDYLLVGDSAGMVLQGARDTLSVSLEDMILYTKSVARGVQSSTSTRKPKVIADLPVGTYTDASVALKSSMKLISSGADMVKLEGPLYGVVEALKSDGISVCGHIGLTPQSIQEYKVQGRTESEAERVFQEAIGLETAGVDMLVLEMIPAALAARITAALKIPTIGIGAGAQTTGQVLVLYDLLGLNPDFNPKFLKKYMNGHAAFGSALKEFAAEVTSGRYPDEDHSFR